ncbi:hypothetical protein [Streptomyces sp. SYSU K217416]
MSDYWGRAPRRAAQRFAQSSGKARDFAGELSSNLRKAHSAVGHIAYNDAPDRQKEQEAAAQN